MPRLRRCARTLPPLLALAALTACGGGGTAAAACAPDAEAPAAAPADEAVAVATVPRTGPRRDPRELDRLTPAEAEVVARLQAAEAAVAAHGAVDPVPLAGGGPAPAQDAAACAPAEEEAGGH